MNFAHFGLVALVGFLLGGVPTAYLAGRLRGIDVRMHGSGNVGGTNAMRLLGWKWGVSVMVFDLLKGYVLTRWLPTIMDSGAEQVYLALLAGTAAVLGHVFTPYLKLRGGKGVATAAGMFLALSPASAALAAAVFFAVAFGTRIVSLASLAASCTLPLASFLLNQCGVAFVHPAVQWLTVAVAALVAWTHRTNVRRLLAGTESRFGRR